jgi:hypothetical protein
MGAEPALIAEPRDVTAVWLTDVLRHARAIGAGTAVAGLDAAAIGTGQAGANIRYSLTYTGDPGPRSIVCKFASQDPQSAATGVFARTYETEVMFYRELASGLAISRPDCYFAAVEPGTARVVLVLEDVAPADQGDQLAGCTIEQAALALGQAARLHGPRWGDPSLQRWDRSELTAMVATAFDEMWAAFVDRYAATVDDVVLEAGAQLNACIAATVEPPQPGTGTLVHFDYRLDNILFHPDPDAPRPLVVVDWQTVQLGLGAGDIAYFLGSALEPEARRRSEEELVVGYHRALVEQGVTDYSLERCWDDYRRSSFNGLRMAVLASLGVEQTVRGDAMFAAMARRSAHMAIDLDARRLLQRSS